MRWLVIDRSQTGRLLTEMVEIGRTFHIAGHRSRARGLTGTAYGVLQQLRDTDARLTELSARLEVSAPVVSRTVHALEADGLVERHQDPQDARAAVLSITERGCEYLARRESAVVDLFAERLAEWSPTEVERMIAALALLREELADVFDVLGSAHVRRDSRTPGNSSAADTDYRSEIHG